MEIAEGMQEHLKDADHVFKCFDVTGKEPQHPWVLVPQRVLEAGHIEHPKGGLQLANQTPEIISATPPFSDKIRPAPW